MLLKDQNLFGKALRLHSTLPTMGSENPCQVANKTVLFEGTLSDSCVIC